MPRVIVALNEPEGNRDFIVYAKRVTACVADASRFPSPRPSLAVLQSAVDALDSAEVAVGLRGRGSSEERDARRLALHGELDVLRSYVQGLASLLPAPQAREVVELSGLSVKASSGHGKPAFEVKPGPVSGAVHLVARAETTRASYRWQSSKDGVTWASLDDTVRADAWLHGLEPGVRYSFRYRTTTKAGLGDWSEVLWLLVA